MSFEEEVVSGSEIKEGDFILFEGLYEVVKRAKSRNGKIMQLFCKDPIRSVKKTLYFHDKYEIKRFRPKEKIVEILAIQSGILLCMNGEDTEEIEVVNLSVIDEDNLPIKAVLREYPNEKIHTIKSILG